MLAGHSHVLVASEHAGRIKDMAHSVSTHSAHQNLTGVVSHFARDATHLAAPLLCAEEVSAAEKAHRRDNRGKHSIPPDHAARSCESSGSDQYSAPLPQHAPIRAGRPTSSYGTVGERTYSDAVRGRSLPKARWNDDDNDDDQLWTGSARFQPQMLLLLSLLLRIAV